MSSVCFPIVQCEVIRMTRLDSCGVPAWGDCARVVTDGFVSVAITANYDDGTEIVQQNAAGRRCVQKDAEPEFINFGIDVQFCNVDPEAYAMATGQSVIYDAQTGDAIGFKVNRGVRPGDVRWALEGWSNAQGTNAAACDPNGLVPYVYFGWPFLSGARIGDFTLENNAVTFTASGALTKDGSGWGAGPYLVTRDSNGDPSVLIDVVDVQDHMHMFRTTVAPPEPDCGCLPLDDPNADPSTGATAGIPGVFTPADSNRPDTSMVGIIASPLTAWTTGQYVLTEDGNPWHWDGDSWEAGVAP